MKTKSPHLIATLLLAVGSPGMANAQSCETLINLSFAAGNPGDVAAHPNISGITPWTNGSETLPDIFGANVFYMPDPDFGNGYAGLTVPPARFGFMWGFEGGFFLTGTNEWDVCVISFDYDVLGHNGEASLALGVGSWSGNAPLPSTGPQDSGPIFGPVAIGERATGSVTFDFNNQSLTVTRDGYGDYTTSFAGSHQLGAGSHAIDILVSNTAPSKDGGWDVNADSAFGNAGFYRLDNFRIIVSQVPEPSASIAFVLGVGLLMSRRRDRV